jgi:hypothetical protein
MLLPSGVWVLGPGDSSLEIRKIKTFMRSKFRAYAGGLANTDLYDQQMVDAVSEMQRRYGVPVTGYIGYSTKVLMGYLTTPTVDLRPMLFTVCGTGVPWWVGPDADTARAVEDLYNWQPIGYPAQPVPMGPSINAGKAELINQFNIHRAQVERCGAALAIYSQGAVVGSEVWEQEIKPASGQLHWAFPYIRKAVAWGNPSREIGKAWPDPGGELADPSTGGVAYKDDRMKDTPDWWRNYAHKGDLYTTGSDGLAGQDKTAIWRIIRGEKFFVGPDTLLEQFLEVAQQPIPGAIGAFKAMWDAMSFFGSGTKAHITYDIGPAIAFLRAA